MNHPTELPAHIGGFQHLEPDVTIEHGDIYVERGVPAGFCVATVGEQVGRIEPIIGQNIYRLSPPPTP